MSGSSLRLFIVNIIYLGQVNQHKNIFPSILNAFVIFLYFCVLFGEKAFLFMFYLRKTEVLSLQNVFHYVEINELQQKNTCNIFSCEDLMIRKNSLACTDSCYIAFVQSR